MGSETVIAIGLRIGRCPYGLYGVTLYDHSIAGLGVFCHIIPEPSARVAPHPHPNKNPRTTCDPHERALFIRNQPFPGSLASIEGGRDSLTVSAGSPGLTQAAGGDVSATAVL
jgi:hypothetical protein